MQAMQKNLNPTEMAESVDIQTIVNQVAAQAMTTVIMTLRDADVGPQPATTSAQESHRDMAGQP